ncbi:hypothetical protein MFIFM68171_04004 [Madurella fahalii]|uniref:Uncharacterized protein n=1 Tax=Madurella fahalii TaxID=1157608 RepID=A0ABQ0G7R2_9PEZI
MLENNVKATEPEVGILIANGLTYGQAWYLWERARPALSEPFNGAFDIEDFNISLERICLNHGKQVTGAEVMTAFSEMAVLWRRAEGEFVRGFEVLLLGNDDDAFHCQFSLIEKAKAGCKSGMAVDKGTWTSDMLV